MAWCCQRSSYLNVVLVLLLLPMSSWTENISTTTPVPPLQWINLTTLLRGSPPPPLKDVSIGYDEASRSVLIFGGESESGFAQGQTFLLNLDTLTWSTPAPPPNLQSTPAARSGALGGGDFAASNRHGHVLIGGRGSDGKPLSDVWEYDYINQFWSEIKISPGGPSARWGSSGGIDIRTMPISDPVVPGPNNTFYLAGGFDGTTASSLSDVWRLNVSGTLSSNLPDSVRGFWEHLGPIDNLPAKVNQAGTMVSQRIIVSNGCNSDPSFNNSCAQSDAYIMNTATNSVISIAACPAPRSSAVLVPNLNVHLSTFSSQVFLLLGTFDTTRWQDDTGLAKGEVAVLDISTGTWSRVLPSGDPGTSGKPSFPGPRRGAAALSFSSALVGQSRATASDIIVFGGQDASGTYLSEVWLLRAYNGSVTRSDQQWPGFAEGRLQSGPNANGAGVTVQFMTACASWMLNATNTSPSSAADGSKIHPFDTSFTHKLFSSLSVALIFPVVLLSRLASTSSNVDRVAKHHIIMIIAALVASVAYITGIAGIALSFASITSTLTFTERSPVLQRNFKTGHGKIGLVLFVCLYGVVPLLLLLSVSRHLRHDKKEQASVHTTVNMTKETSTPNEPVVIPPHSVRKTTPTSTPHLARLHKHFPTFWPRNRLSEGQPPNDTESVDSTSSTQQRSFEVINRPSRTHRISGHLSYLSTDSSNYHRNIGSLGDVDRLERRQALSAVGDDPISRVNREPSPFRATLKPLAPIIPPPQMPHLSDIILRLFFQLLILALCIHTLVALWFRAPRPYFIIFMLWAVVFYISVLVLAWHGRPHQSFLTVMVNKFRANLRTTPGTPAVAVRDISPSPTIPSDRHQSPIDSRGPYRYHQPPYRSALSTGHEDTSQGLRTAEIHDEDGDDDEDTHQRIIEEEMGRRDVSIITVPKRKLFIANAS